jgi:hypothetical protein
MAVLAAVTLEAFVSFLKNKIYCLVFGVSKKIARKGVAGPLRPAATHISNLA